MKEESLLKIKNSRVTFFGADLDIEAVRGVSLNINKNEVLGVVGESGSGKSALALSLMKLHNPRHTKYEGEAVFLGRDVYSMNEKALQVYRGREASIVFQEPMNALNPVMKIGEQVSESLFIHTKLGKERIREKALERLKDVGISDAERRFEAYPHELSGGMRQRVMLAIATMLSPALLIADEITTALDVTIQRQVIDLLEKLKAEMGMSIMFISHDLGVISSISDKIAVMYLGKIVEYASKEDILSSPKHPYTEALLDIARGFEESSQTLSVIPGSVPSHGNIPQGCSFHPRCKYKTQICEKEEPTQTNLENGRQVSCFHACN